MFCAEAREHSVTLGICAHAGLLGHIELVSTFDYTELLLLLAATSVYIPTSHIHGPIPPHPFQHLFFSVFLLMGVLQVVSSN